MRSPHAAQREATSGYTRVFDALWRNGAPQMLGPGWCPKAPRSRFCSASLRAALRPGHVAIVAAITLLLGISGALAQAGDTANKKITMIVGFAPGGGVDVLARVVAQELNDNAGFQIVIENRPGAGSNIAAKTVAGAAPDGATLFFTGNSYAINQTIYRNPGYATADLRPVAIAALDSQGLAVNAANPAKTLGDFVKASKDKPPSFGFGGSSSRIIAEYVLKVMAKTEATAVPFQSGAPALNALLGNHVDIIAAPLAELVPQVAQGAVRVLAVSGGKRSPSFPDVPMLREAGFPGLEIHGWIGILAPAGTPDDICLKINSAVNAAVGKPAINARLRQLGYEPHGSMSLADSGPFLTDSIETWRKMILATGMAIN
jgi:tripartite-type tricarboxylate transporter receptor subunit TctC